MSLHASNPPLVLLQLTDPHLFADDGALLQGVDTDRCFQAVLRQALLEHPQATALLLTGDLAHDESAGAYRRLAGRLQDVDLPIHLIPGNHDDNPRLQDIVHGNLHSALTARYGNWQLVLLNSQLPGSAGGHLGEEELAALEAALADAPEHHALVCLHHNAVDTGSAWLDTMTLDNTDALFVVLDRHPQVRAVIWGHVHQEQQSQHGDIQLLGCPATCFQFKPYSVEFETDPIEPGYRWLRLFPDGRIETGISRLKQNC